MIGNFGNRLYGLSITDDLLITTKLDYAIWQRMIGNFGNGLYGLSITDDIMSA